MAPKKPLTTPQARQQAKVHVEGDAFYVDDLTLVEVALCEDETGESWLAVNPYRSAKWSKAIMTRFLARKIGEDKAAAVINGYTLRQALSCIELVPEDDRPVEYSEGVPVVNPKAATDDSATTGS